MTPTRRVSLYFGLLAVVGGLADPNGGLVQLPLLFLLKDGLRRSPEWVAWFVAVTSVPGHLGFLFGALRDRWRPPRLGDRAYFLLIAVATTTGYLWIAIAPVSLVRLLVGSMVIAISFQVFDASASALLTVVAQRRLMTGRLISVVEIADSAVSVVAMLVGGWLAGHASPEVAFSSVAMVAVFIAVFGFWAPHEVFDATRVSEGGDTRPFGLRALLRSHGLWPVLMILLLYSFSPGWGTPFFFYLTSKITISNEAFGLVRSVSFATIAGATALYGVLCSRVPLKTLLWCAILMNIFPGFLFLFVRSVPYAVVAAAIGGLCTGFGSIALLDLLTRASPKSMEGTASMLGVSAIGLAWTVGDVLGARIYQYGGFALCIIVDAVATIAIVPLLLRLPSRLIAYADGDGPEGTLEVQPG